MIERWGREAAGDAGKAEFISILHFQKEAPTTLTQKQTAQPPCKQHAQWCSPGIQSASNSLPLSTSAALCSAANFGPVDTIHQSSLPLSFWAVHAVCILIALFIHQQSGKMCAHVHLHLWIRERACSRSTPRLFYYSNSCVDPLWAHRHLPMLHTKHTDPVPIYSSPPVSLFL